MMFDGGGGSSMEEEEWDSRRDLAAAVVGMDITAAAMPVRLRVVVVLVVLDIMVLVPLVRGAMSAAVLAAAIHSRRMCVDDNERWSVEAMVRHCP